MNITGSIVLYLVIWFITFWCALPVGLRTQGDENDVVHGTPESAPNNLRLGRKLIWSTVIATLIWSPIVYYVVSNNLSMWDLFSVQ